MKILNQPLQKEIRVEGKKLNPEMRTLSFPVTGYPEAYLGKLPPTNVLPILEYTFDRTEVIHVYKLTDVRI